MNGNLTTIQNGVAIRNGYLPGKLHNWSWHAERQTALPNGNLHPYGWMLPRTGGAMSMRAEGEGSIEADLVPTINGAIDFTGTGDLTAEAALVISMAIAMTGSGTLSASIVGLLNMSIDLEGSGDLAANLSGIGNMLIDLEGSGSLEATIAAYGNMEIDIVVTGTGLTTSNVGQAVWAALAALNDEVGTMGEKLNDAGSASNPWADTTDYGAGTKGQLLEDAAAATNVWTQVIESGYTAEEILRILAAVAAGKSSGQPTAPVFRDLGDTKDRVTGTVDSSGNRTSVTVDET